jgi:hypothetical protein
MLCVVVSGQPPRFVLLFQVSHHTLCCCFRSATTLCVVVSGQPPRFVLLFQVSHHALCCCFRSATQFVLLFLVFNHSLCCWFWRSIPVCHVKVILVSLENLCCWFFSANKVCILMSGLPPHFVLVVLISNQFALLVLISPPRLCSWFFKVTQDYVVCSGQPPVCDVGSWYGTYFFVLVSHNWTLFNIQFYEEFCLKHLLINEPNLYTMTIV